MIDINFLELFYEIDSNNNGVISKLELKKYLECREISNEEIELFIKAFDNHEDIEFADFFKILNKDENEHEHDLGVEIIQTKISDFHTQWKIANIIRRAWIHGEDKKSLAENVKRDLDKQMGESWHCFISKGQYSACYSYEDQCSIAIKFEKLVFILFKTPGSRIA